MGFELSKKLIVFHNPEPDNVPWTSVHDQYMLILLLLSVVFLFQRGKTLTFVEFFLIVFHV